MSHIPEGELALYAAGPDAIAEGRRAEIETHLAVCAECQEAHDFFAIRDDDLADPDIWEPIIGTATHAALMEYGARVAEEDRDAEVLLEPFLANPISTAWTTFTTKRRHLTGGVVRKLNAAAHSICESKPRVALTFADAAISVAEALSDDIYPARAVYRLRGTAWKERANAQMSLRHRALVIFREIGPESERLATEWGIARVLFHGEKLSEAIRRLRGVAVEFEKLGMVTFAAYVGLDISDGLLALNRPQEIVSLAQHLFSTFTNAGILTGALSAIAYLKEAAAAKRLTRQDVESIRTFLRRAERQPSLQFVRPPKAP